MFRHAVAVIIKVSSAQEVSSIRALGDSQCADAIEREYTVNTTTGIGNLTATTDIVFTLVVRG